MGFALLPVRRDDPHATHVDVPSSLCNVHFGHDQYFVDIFTVFGFTFCVDTGRFVRHISHDVRVDWFSNVHAVHRHIRFGVGLRSTLQTELSSRERDWIVFFVSPMSSRENLGQQQTIANAIAKNLDNYADDQILVELLQNADDAGATRWYVLCLFSSRGARPTRRSLHATHAQRVRFG